jgi:YVTN family beta-propeller protein
VDKANNVVRVMNSNTMEVITTLTGFSAPDSAEVSSDLTKLYVTNSGSGFLSVFDADPMSADFLSHVSDVPVGILPKGICVQPDNEDVLVCNFGSSSISIIDVASNTVRKTVSALVSKPWDLVAGPRQTTFGFGTGVYHAYIANFGGDNVLVFESGPDGFGGIGFDDILDPIPEIGSGGTQYLPIEDPRGICWDPHFVDPNFLNGGCFVGHSSGATPVVSRINFTKQQAPWGPVFLQPNSGAIGGTPGFGKRVFEITAQWGGPANPLSVSQGAVSDIATMDYNRDYWLYSNWTGNPYVTNFGTVSDNPSFGLPKNHKHPNRILNFHGSSAHEPVALPDRMFVSFAFSNSVDVINPLDGSLVKTITGLPAPAKVLKSYFKY